MDGMKKEVVNMKAYLLQNIKVKLSKLLISLMTLMYVNLFLKMVICLSKINAPAMTGVTKIHALVVVVKVILKIVILKLKVPAVERS